MFVPFCQTCDRLRWFECYNWLTVEINTICDRKTHRNDPENGKKTKTFTFLSLSMQFLDNLRRISWARISKTIKIETTQAT